MQTQKNMRILAVDDEVIFLDILHTLFTCQGYQQNVRAQSAAEALELLRDPDQQFDCILLDIQMPGMNGIELCKKIRSMPKYVSTPILMLTSLAEQIFIDQAFGAGASDYVTKPINDVELNARMRSAFNSITEKNRIEALTWQVQTTSVDQVGLNFSDPIALPEVEDLMGFLAMQNYLLTLGSLRSNAWLAVGFHIMGAARFFANSHPRDYLDMVQDVGIAIRDGLKTRRFLSSYAGNGEFVALIDKKSPIDPDDLQERLKDFLEPFREFHLAGSGQTVDICVGEPCGNALLTFASPTAPINAALLSARQKSVQAQSVASSIVQK
jgi:CheY-like chemotaxis protein